MTDNRLIIPACEDFATIAAALRAIEEEKQRERAKPDSDAQPEVDYSGYDGA